MIVFARGADGNGIRGVAQFDQAIGRHEGVALGEGPLDALLQGVGGEGLEDVVVGGELGGADNPFVLAFAGDHDEQGRQGDDVVEAQVFEQVLAVLPFAQVVFAEDQVEAVVPQLAYCGARGDGELDLADAAQVEHVAKLRPHGGIGFDDKGSDGVEIDHGGSRADAGTMNASARSGVS